MKALLPLGAFKYDRCMSENKDMISDEAVEAAANELKRHVGVKDIYAARDILEAATPHMRDDKRGEGDYLPGWDDRKTLAHLWQAHAPLPSEGLTERVYDALIAAAKWGYEQRAAE